MGVGLSGWVCFYFRIYLCLYNLAVYLLLVLINFEYNDYNPDQYEYPADNQNDPGNFSCQGEQYKKYCQYY